MIECKYCGNTDCKSVYMLKKENQIGLYCNKCGKWLKWVGKKEVVALRGMGVIFHRNCYQNSQVHTDVQPKLVVTKQSNLGVQISDDIPFEQPNSVQVVNKEQNVQTKPAVKSEEQLSCLSCGGTTFEKRQVSMHTGLYCTNCGKWRKWIKKGK